MKRLAIYTFYVLTGIAVFSLSGFLLPYLFYQYVDKREYYKIEVPVLTNQQEYKPCDTVAVPVTRNAEIDVNGTVFVELLKIEQGNVNIEIETQKVDVLIEKGRQTRLLLQKIPCEAQTGFYQIFGRVSFKVHGVDHNHDFVTNTFEVK